MKFLKISLDLLAFPSGISFKAVLRRTDKIYVSLLVKQNIGSNCIRRIVCPSVEILHTH